MLVRLISAAAVMMLMGTAQERRVDPTFLYRRVADVNEARSDLTTSSSHYRPVFGAGDRDARTLKSIARFGELTVDAHGSSAKVSYPDEEQVYVVLDGNGALGYGDRTIPLRAHDFAYLPAGVPHGLTAGDGSCRAIVMGFRLPKGEPRTPPSTPQIANMDEVPLQTVEGHPASTLYRLLIGDVSSKRDRLATGHSLVSLFLMEFAPGGTNFPHHHERAEEIYLVLDGHGDMVAGGGMDGIEGRHPARAGDAYFFRLNCTVGFYAANTPGEKARILAVRSWYPGMKLPGGD